MHFFILSVFTNVLDYANIGIGEDDDYKTTKEQSRRVLWFKDYW